MLVVDVTITSKLGRILVFLLEGIQFCFDFLRGIKFYGTNLFTFIITIFLLGIILPILFSIVRSEAVHNQNFRERVNKIRSRRKGE